MNTVLLIICVISATIAFISFLVGQRSQTKRTKRIAYVLAVSLFAITISSAILGHYANIESKAKLGLAHEEAAEARANADAAQARITAMQTPRRMRPETKNMLVARLKPYAGQKYDMKVFRDQDSLALARALQTIFEEAGWVHTNVYPTYRTDYAEAHKEGVWVVAAKGETSRTSKARSALHAALQEAGLYDDSTVISPIACVEGTGIGGLPGKLTVIPCSKSPIRITGVDLAVQDEVLPKDTLGLHVGKQRL